MTDEQKAEIERLAGIAHAKQEHWRWLGMCNTSTDPDKARGQAVKYRLAQTEMMVANAELRRAQGRVAGLSE